MQIKLLIAQIKVIKVIKVAKKKNIKAIICLGENNEKIISAFKNDVDIIQQA